MLDRVSIKSPCTASWDAMVGDDAVRFCCICSKNVYDLSAMDADTAEAFLEQHLGGTDEDETKPSTCVRLFRRPDGRILTSECATGQRGRHARRTAVTLAAGLAATAIALTSTEAITRPTLHEGDPDWLTENRPAWSGPTRSVSMGAVRERDDGWTPPPFQIDEVALAEEAESESELLGTSARTARAVNRRREAAVDPVIPGSVHLVRPRSIL